MTPVQRLPEPRADFRPRPRMLHPECPIEQSLHAADPAVQAQLMQEIWVRRSSIDEGALLIADPDCVRVLARTEGALRAPVEALRQRYAPALVVEPPTVRYAHGAPVLEPYMNLLLCGAEPYLPPVQKELAKRRSVIRRLDRHGGRFVLEAEAPLGNLLGLGDWLGARTNGAIDASMWLSRYLPIDDDGPFAA